MNAPAVLKHACRLGKNMEEWMETTTFVDIKSRCLETRLR